MLGRFTSEDSAQDGLNWYTYCGNNPLNFIDPSGNFSLPQIFGGSLLTTVGTIAMIAGLSALTVATGGMALLAFGATVAGAATVTFGANEMYAGFTGSNPLRNFYGNDDLYYGAMAVSATVATAGAYGFTQYNQVFANQTAQVANPINRQTINTIAQANNQSASTPSSVFTSNSYNVSELFKSQSYTHSSIVNGIMETITQKGANAVEPIKVIVRDGVAMIVDGHHRFQAFVNLGYTRVPIQYIHENQIWKYTVMTLKEIIEFAHK